MQLNTDTSLVSLCLACVTKLLVNSSSLSTFAESVGGWNSGRMTVEELEKMQFMEAQKARQLVGLLF